MEEASIRQLQRRMAEGELSARALTEQYLERIRALDKAGPALNSVIALNPDALEIAEALDEERREQGPRGPLHGIPLLLKDNIDTADMPTTAGSLALEGIIPQRDAFLVERLRGAGALILGKTNLSEWAYFRSPRGVSGWSSAGGQTRNPYALDRNPSGSSSGSGVAVAAGLCPGAIGTETDGSIVSPSAANGIVGIKPTVGLVSRSGIVPIAHSQDTAGPMAGTVADAALLLGVMAGADPRDPATEAATEHTHADYTQFLDADGLRGARIGVARNFFGLNRRVDALMEQAIETMRGLGAEIVDPANVVVGKALEQSEMEVFLYEFKADLNEYLGCLGTQCSVHSLADVIAFNERHAERVLPYFGQEFMLLAEAKGPLTDEAYREALATNHRLTRDEGIDATMREHRLDAIVAPTGSPAWLIDLVNGDHYLGGSSTPAAVAGYPNISIPLGFVFGLPVGISFFAGAWQEPILIRLAYAFEQATQVRRPPRFLSTVDLNEDQE